MIISGSDVRADENGGFYTGSRQVAGRLDYDGVEDRRAQDRRGGAGPQRSSTHLEKRVTRGDPRVYDEVGGLVELLPRGVARSDALGMREARQGNYDGSHALGMERYFYGHGVYSRVRDDYHNIAS